MNDAQMTKATVRVRRAVAELMDLVGKTIDLFAAHFVPRAVASVRIVKLFESWSGSL